MLALLTAVLCTQQVTLDLSNLDISAIKQGWGKPQRGRSVDGNPLSVAGHRYLRGIGTHAKSRLEINLAGKALRFTALAGVDDEIPRDGDVTFEVWVDGKRLIATPILKKGDAAFPIDVDLKGANRMEFAVTDGGDDIDYDHADWIEPTITVLRDGAHLIKPMAPKLAAQMTIATGVSPAPRFNGPKVVGCSPGKPFLFRIPTSGQRPLKFQVSGLPAGLRLEADTGIISGKVEGAGTYDLAVSVTGPKGSDRRNLRIVCGTNKLALTPPMGWNSWNVWGTTVDAEKVRAAADQIVATGLADFGFAYVNIDDAWEGERGPDGVLKTNEKFPDMALLASQVHGDGLKLGIYSSPGPKTCAGYEGSYQHEKHDADTYAAWGIDYLKYDWCSYGQIAPDNSLVELQRPYHAMRDALRASSRDIVYSLCQYGMGDVWKWGRDVGGNLWRTTGDITDTWESLSDIAFRHSEYAVQAGPGGWNDPDMLILGYLGWGPDPRPTRLTRNEQITHISLWAMFAAPLLIGCDLTRLDQFTLDLLTNHDIIAVDQDELGVPARRAIQNGTSEVWVRPLADGSFAVALVNRGEEATTIGFEWQDLNMPRAGLESSTASLWRELPSGSAMRVEDLWQRKDLGMKQSGYKAKVLSHATVMLRVGARK